MRRKNKKMKIVAFLFSIILMGIGYAYLTANLKITGTTKIGSARFDVHFENAALEGASSNVTYPSNSNSNLAQGIPVIKGENNTELEWNVVLNQPGDYYLIRADIVNSGDIDAQLDLENSTFKIKIDEEETSYSLKNIIYKSKDDVSFTSETSPIISGIYFENSRQTYLNSGERLKVIGGIRLDEYSMTNEVWESIRGKDIKVTIDFKYIQGVDNPSVNATFSLVDGVSVRFENESFYEASETTSFPNNIKVPTIVNDRVSETKTSHTIEYNVVFNQPGDYYTYKVILVNDGKAYARGRTRNSEITIGDNEPVYFGSIDFVSTYYDIFDVNVYSESLDSYFNIPEKGNHEFYVTLRVKDDISEEDLALIQGKNINVKYYLEYYEYDPYVLG